MYVLGLNGGLRLGYQDVSAVLLCNGEVIAAAEEERFNRIKNSPGQLPERSIEFVLKQAGIGLADVDHVATHGQTWGADYRKRLSEYLNFRFKASPKIFTCHHHEAHAASSFFASDFDHSMILTMDSSGDGISTRMSVGRKDAPSEQIKLLREFERPNSLGIFYSMITQFCGFQRDRDEYKLMGLASYGNSKRVDLSDLFSSSVSSTTNELSLNTDYLAPITAGQGQRTRQEPMFSDRLKQLLGDARAPYQPITSFYQDVAAAAQEQLEQTVCRWVSNLHKETGLRKLCLAGGVALNCVLNQKLQNLDFIDEIYIQPASGDSGISLGAAYLCSLKHGRNPLPMNSVFLGSDYTDSEIHTLLRSTGIEFQELSSPAESTAKLISENKVVGWFQDRMEFGPRALGSRSILANPRSSEMPDRLNKKIKFRESFRPFCPSVIEESCAEYFSGNQLTNRQLRSPHMTITYDVTEAGEKLAPAITHTDKTARIQTVNSANQPLFHSLLKELQKKIDIPLTINTSFNTAGEPIVESPSQAIATFYRSGMDALIIGQFLIEKKCVF